MEIPKRPTLITGPNYYELSDAETVRENWYNWIGSETNIGFDDPGFRSVGNAIFLDGLTITEGWTDSGAVSQRPPTHLLTQHVLHDKPYHVDGIDLGDKNAAVLSLSERPLFKKQTSNVSVLFVMTDHAVIETYLSKMLGGLGPPLQFADSGRSSAPMMLRLRRALFSLVADHNQMGSRLSPIALQEMQRLLMFEMLLCNPHNYTHMLLGPARDPNHNVVVLVEGYLEASWDLPFSIDDIVKVSGVTARSLFRYFRKHRGYSPFEFLRDVRLRKARQFLLAGNPDDGVIAIALRCGFASPGRMASWYFQMFGEYPSETHRRAVADHQAWRSVSRIPGNQ